jgi:signal transduction histidine kinase
MPAGSRRWLTIFLCSSFLCSSFAIAVVQPLVAQDARQQRVLVLYATAPSAPAGAIMDTVFQRTLGDALGTGLDLHSEFIDTTRFNGSDYPDALSAFLRYKFERAPLDVVIATSRASRQFVERYRADLFRGVPVVFVDRATAERPAGMTGISTRFDLAQTLDLALTLQPQTRHVFVIHGVSEFDRFYEAAAREQFQRYAERVTVTYLSGLALTKLQEAVAQLPPDSIIYTLPITEDATGTKFRTTQALDGIALVANAPIYSWNEVAMNHGIVGGRLHGNGIIAQRTAELALRILRGENPDSIPILPVDQYSTQLDWRQLQRWGIKEAGVPQGALILFREPSLWDQYKFYIGGTLALVVVQAAFIAGLLVQRARRRRVQAALRESHRQISDLFGRLIRAQETERTRIARDLHDDVSQRIAALGIMISRMKRRLRGEPSEADVVPALMAMQENTMQLSEEIRRLSHDLHPALLQHAGLVTALSVFCAEFEKLHGTAVTYRATPDAGPFDANTALGLYRITQEVFRNVAKHAEARHVDVALTSTAEAIVLTITDDGKGFDVPGTQAKGAGLGLVSIDERVRLLRGSVHIDTHPRGGTRVRVEIPGPGTPPVLDQLPAPELAERPV